MTLSDSVIEAEGIKDLTKSIGKAAVSYGKKLNWYHKSNSDSREIIIINS